MFCLISVAYSGMRLYLGLSAEMLCSPAPVK